MIDSKRLQIDDKGILKMDEWMNYEQFDRQTWHRFFPTDSVRLSQDNLDEIKSLNDRISLTDVQDVYLPLIKLLQLHYQNFLEWRLGGGREEYNCPASQYFAKQTIAG